MPLPKDFAFSGIAPVQRATERIAETLFGKGWRDTCDIQFADDINIGLPTVSCGNVMLAYSKWSVSIRRDGEENDVAGIPSKTNFGVGGGVEAIWHIRDGHCNNLDDGSPACIEYYKNGKPKRLLYMTNNRYRDSADGHPAEIHYTSDGEVSHGKSSELGKDLTAEECMEMLRQAQVRRGMAWAESNLPQGVGVVGMHSPSLSDVRLDHIMGRDI